VMGEMFNIMTNVKTVHVPYRGETLALTDILSRQVDVLFVSGTFSIEQVRTGAVRALGVTTATRSVALPEVPPIGETVPGYDAGGFAGISAPRGIPSEIVVLLNREINAALENPDIKARYDDLGARTIKGSPTDFGKFMRDETEKWGKVIRGANIKPA
jgi:tripartite-type tricarboxylate transporter receptor subunit TctC